MLTGLLLSKTAAGESSLRAEIFVNSVETMDSPITRSMLQKQLLCHWAMLRPGVLPTDVLACVRCANPSAPTCKFHTDAKAFAFGSGRFDFEYASLWDTPHGEPQLQWGSGFENEYVEAKCIGMKGRTVTGKQK